DLYVDFLEIAFGLGADLDAAGGAVAVRRLLDGPLVCAIQQRADFVAAHQAIGDGHVLGGAREPEAVAALQDDGVVVGCVDAGVGDPDVAAGVGIHSVAGGGGLEIVDGQVIDACHQDAEVPAGEDGKFAQSHVV